MAFCLSILLGPAAAFAEGMLDLDVALFQDAFKTDGNAAHNKSFYGLGLYVDLGSKQRFYFGATYAGGSSSDKEGDAEATTLSFQDILLGFKWFMDRQRMLSLTAGYGFASAATYKVSGGEAEKWRGTGTFAKFTVAPEIKNWNIGLSVLYYAGAFKEKNLETTTEQVSYNATFLLPSLAIGYNW
ncbi:MAG: hypothetical protein KF802_13895 [Bdellovibrionaceae bacterium]|nr:hypothetical protein [Pseudobdellovibrionaceae bacterium]MBX3033120.1 hypothetical protein [Pseudobdellovibrionaceae bacterium]